MDSSHVVTADDVAEATGRDVGEVEETWARLFGGEDGG